MPQPRILTTARIGAAAQDSVRGMLRRPMRRMHDEQAFRDLCAEAAPLRCRG